MYENYLLELPELSKEDNTVLQKEKSELIFGLLVKSQPNAKCELCFQTPFELLVAVILSAQCTDIRVNAVTEKLFTKYKTPSDFARMNVKTLEKIIFPCGFYKNKAKNIIACASVICEKYGGDVPQGFDELTSLAGVGRKTASVVQCVAFNIPAMPVDTHVFRVSRRLGLSKSDTVEGVEQDLKNTFAPERWNTLHHALIFHGRYVCKSRKPMCEGCLLREECEYYRKTDD